MAHASHGLTGQNRRDPSATDGRPALFEVVTEPSDRRLSLGDLLEGEADGDYRTFIGNGGTWWSAWYRVVAGPNTGRRLELGGFVDDANGELEWPPDWLRPVANNR